MGEGKTNQEEERALETTVRKFKWWKEEYNITD